MMMMMIIVVADAVVVVETVSSALRLTSSRRHGHVTSPSFGACADEQSFKYTRALCSGREISSFSSSNGMAAASVLRVEGPIAAVLSPASHGSHSTDATLRAPVFSLLLRVDGGAT
jgi:hypothetical protein